MMLMSCFSATATDILDKLDSMQEGRHHHGMIADAIHKAEDTQIGESLQTSSESCSTGSLASSVQPAADFAPTEVH